MLLANKQMSKFDKDLLPGQSQMNLMYFFLWCIRSVVRSSVYKLQWAICYLIMLRLVVPNKLKYNQKQCKKQAPFSNRTLSDLLADTRGDGNSEKTSAKIIIDLWHYLQEAWASILNLDHGRFLATSGSFVAVSFTKWIHYFR